MFKIEKARLQRQPGSHRLLRENCSLDVKRLLVHYEG
jgi:hypothetical protein